MQFAPNPHHRRAKLVQLTSKGAVLFDRASTGWAEVASKLAAGIGPRKLANAAALLRLLRTRLEAAFPIEE